MRKNKVHALTEGAIGTALTVILMLVAMYLPVFALFSVIIVGLPITFLGVRHGMRVTAVAAAASVLMMMLMAGDVVSGLMLGLVHLLPAMAIGYTINRHKPFGVTVFAAAVAVLIGLVAELMLLNAAGGGNGIVNLLDMNIENAKQVFQQAVENLDGGEQLENIAGAINQAFSQVKELLLLYLPAMTIGIACVLGYCTVAVSIFLLRRMQVLKVPYLPFSMFHAPRSMCYLSIILRMISYGAEDGMVIMAGIQNMALLLDCFIGVCGLSLIDAKLSKKISSGYARGGIYLAVLALGYPAIGMIGQILVFLGFLDGLLHFRRFHKVGEGYGEEE